MKTPEIVALPGPDQTKPLAVRLLWMLIIWMAGVGCVAVTSVVLRGVLHH
jgi:hypothetical protein